MDTSSSNTPTTDPALLRLGSIGGIVGSLLAMVGNLLHPETPTGDPAGVARTIAESGRWVAVHLVIVLGLILMLGGLVAISASISNGRAGAMSRLALVAAIAGVTVGTVLVILDGLAAKHLADAWAVAPPAEASTALRLVTASETLNFALAALFNILFAGVTFVLLGVAVLWSGRYAPWLGWVVLVAGAGSLVVGVIQAYAGESTPVTKIATIVFPTVITVWVVGMGWRVLRNASATGDEIASA